MQKYNDQADVNCRNLATRLDRLLKKLEKISNHVKDNESRANNRLPPCRQAQPYNTEDTNAQYFKSVKVDTPCPQAYIDWQLAMDRYFRLCDMSESRKIRFAMMKLTG